MIVATNQLGGSWDGSGTVRPQLPTAHLDVRMGGGRLVLLRPKRIEIISEVGAGTVFASFHEDLWDWGQNWPIRRFRFYRTELETDVLCTNTRLGSHRRV